MPGLLETLRGTFAPEMGAVGLLSDFARNRQDFARQRLQGLLSAQWDPRQWQWSAPDMQTEMTPELEARARQGFANAVGDVFGEGVTPNIVGTFYKTIKPKWSKTQAAWPEGVPMYVDPTKSELGKLVGDMKKSYQLTGPDYGEYDLRLLYAPGKGLFVAPSEGVLHADMLEEIYPDLVKSHPSRKWTSFPLGDSEIGYDAAGAYFHQYGHARPVGDPVGFAGLAHYEGSKNWDDYKYMADLLTSMADVYDDYLTY